MLTMVPSDKQLNDPPARAICLGDRTKFLRMNGEHVAPRLWLFISSLLPSCLNKVRADTQGVLFPPKPLLVIYDVTFIFHGGAFKLPFRLSRPCALLEYRTRRTP